MKNVGTILDTYCKECGKHLNTTRKNKVFCDESCCHAYGHKDGGKHIDNKVCVICGNEFTPNPKAHIVKTCGEVCSKKLQRINKTKRQKDVRKDFRERWGLATGCNSINKEFIHCQDLLENNPALLEALKAIQKIKDLTPTKEQQLENRRELAKGYRSNPEFRKKESERGKEYRKDPKIKERYNLRKAEWVKKKRETDPEWVERRAEYQRKYRENKRNLKKDLVESN